MIWNSKLPFETGIVGCSGSDPVTFLSPTGLPSIWRVSLSVLSVLLGALDADGDNFLGLLFFLIGVTLAGKK